MDHIDNSIESTTTAASPHPPGSLNAESENDAAVLQPSQPRLYPGTGAFVRNEPTDKKSAGAGGQGDITLNFVDADVKEVVRSVLGDLLHLNYALDPKLRTTVTIQTSRPLRREDVLPALEEALRISGVTLIESGNLYRVVPTSEAVQNGSGGPGQGISGPAAVTTRIVPLHYVSAAQIAKLLQPFVPKGGQLQADASRNLLVMSGDGQNLSAINDMIRTFDVDWLSGMSLGIFPLQTGAPRTVASELDAVFSSGTGAPLSGAVKFVPLERINSILVISPQASYLDRARTWIARLDQKDENTPRIFEYHVQNSRAADLARVLTQLLSSGQVFTVEPQVQTAPGTSPARLGDALSGADSMNGGLSSSLPSITGQTGGVSSQQLGPSSATPTTNATPTVAAPSFSTASAPTGHNGGNEAADEGLPRARIVADEKNNALVTFAKPRDYGMIEDAIKRLDVVPLQVLIEATIAEVTLTDDLQYGVEWFFKKGSSQFILSNDPTGAVAPTFPGFNFFVSGNNPKFVLNALSQLTHVNVISSPQLLVLDHNVATLQVGDQVPVPVQQAQSTLTAGAPVINTIQFVDTGVILRVSPRVNSNGLITLDIGQQVSQAVKTTTSGIDAPTIQQRRVDSTITVQDGETIALGGLIQDSRTNGRDGIPVLSDIPVLGNLFGNTTRNGKRTELLILLSPRVIRNSSEARAVTEELRSRLHALAPISPPPAP